MTANTKMSCLQATGKLYVVCGKLSISKGSKSTIVKMCIV